MHSAAAAGHLPIVDALIAAGADGLATNRRQQTALYAAIHHDHSVVVRRLLAVWPQLVCQLTVERWSPLHVACINGSVGLARLLIEYGYADEALRTFRCPQPQATSGEESDTEKQYECRLPFDPNAGDITGQTPLYVACLLGNRGLVQLLLQWRVKVTLQQKRRATNEDAVDDTIVYATQVQTQKSTPSSSASNPSTASQSLSLSSAAQLSPSKRRVSLGIQSIMDRLYLVRESPAADQPDAFAAIDAAAAADSAGERRACPLDLDRLCGAPRETALLAAVRGGYVEVVGLLLGAGADANVMARAMDGDELEIGGQSRQNADDDLYGFTNSPLAEATRQQAVEIVDLLLE